MTATIQLLTQREPLRVSMATEPASTPTPVHLVFGAADVAMTPTEARALAAALLTAAEFGAKRTLRREGEVDERLRALHA